METAKKHQLNDQHSTEVGLQEKAYLVQGTEKFPIHAECASKYSLFFRFADEHKPADLKNPVNLVIQNNGAHLEVGPCRILSDPAINGYTGRIVFEHDVYDAESLLNRKKIEKLQAQASGLNPLLAQKEKVRSSFKNYIGGLSYDLSVYKRLFDSMDAKYSSEPGEVRNAVQKAIIYSEGPELRQYFESQLDELKNLVDGFSPEEHRLHGFYFRRQLWTYILACPFTARATLKPRGYAGDSKLMRMIYLNDYQGDTTYSKITHKHAVEHTAAQSVRNRIELIAGILKKRSDAARQSSMEKIKVLSVACGPAFELKQILQSPQDFQRYRFTLFDQDATALSEAADVSAEIENEFGRSPAVEYIQGSVRSMLFSRQLRHKWGQFHFIYSMGLFDYLNTRVATAVVDRMYRLLKPGGELVVGNFHITNPSKYYMQYWGDWHLIHRTESEMRELSPQNSEATVSILYDDTGSQMFLYITKPKTAIC
jgi:extracellular factor (EF) 3-hydroxypalmitic acid methyl ester biosynthesis protein